MDNLWKVSASVLNTKTSTLTLFKSKYIDKYNSDLCNIERYTLKENISMTRNNVDSVFNMASDHFLDYMTCTEYGLYRF